MSTEIGHIITICNDCAYFNEYGRLDDMTMDENPQAGIQHAARIAAIWPAGTKFASGCGRDCEEHGIAAYDGDERAYETALGERDTDTWFSWSECEECGSTPGGTREHATAWMPA